MISERQKRVLKYLSNTKEWVKGKEIANVLNVTDRTIRNDILEINTYFKEEKIIALKGKGYKLNRIIPLEVGDLASDIESINNKERILYILKRLIVEKDGCNIFDLADELFVSESTIQGDILKIKKVLKNLAIDYVGISRTKDIILLNCNSIERYGVLYEVAKFSFINIEINDMQKCFGDIDLESIYVTIKKLLEEYRYESRYLRLTKITLYMALIIETKDRINCDFEGMDFKEPCNLIVNALNRKLGLGLCENSLNAIMYKFKVSRDMHIIENNIRENNTLCSDEYEFYKEKILNATRNFNLGIENEEELFNDLIIHIMVAVERIKRGIKVHNPLRKNIRDKNPFVFWLSKNLVKEIELEKGIVFDFNELSFIGAYLSIISIEEEVKLKSIRDINILLIVSDSKANLNYVFNELKMEFVNQNINIYPICRFNELWEDENFGEYDLVIATSKLDGEFLTDKYLVIRKNFDYVEKEKILKEVLIIKKRLFKERLMELLNSIDLELVDEKKCKDIMRICKEKKFNYSRNGVDFVYSVGDVKKCSKILIVASENTSKAQDRVKIYFIVSKSYKEIRKLNWIISYFNYLATNSVFLEGVRLCNNYDELKYVIGKIYLKELT